VVAAESGTGRSAGRPEGKLEIEGLTCLRGEHIVFEALRFAVEPGTILQLIGPNGSGKTSLLRILSGLASPYAGTVQWRGTDIHQHLQLWHQQVCVTGHLAGVAGALTARENLAVALALNAELTHGGIADALAAVGLAGYAEVLAARLSAGQRQRLALARLVLSSAPVWLLDEPLTALDHDGKLLVEQLLEAHTRRGGLAVLATHQDLDSVRLQIQNYHLQGTPAR
jgi:heme exporter protein A